MRRLRDHRGPRSNRPASRDPDQAALNGLLQRITGFRLKVIDMHLLAAAAVTGSNSLEASWT
jgi:hypothetical protein